MHAAAALANMAEMVEGRTHDRMIEEGVLKPLMRLADSQEAEVKSGEKWREPLLCSHPSETDSHPPLVRVHAMQLYELWVLFRIPMPL